jgi:phenylalanine-4-hydroxylase
MTKYIAKTPDQNGFLPFTEQEDQTWSILIKRQRKIVETRACKEYLDGLDILNMPEDRVPQCVEISATLGKRTGWSVTPVPALIPAEEFFTLLANKQFPAAAFVRIPEELDYLQEPDIFHEYFGHCPLLTNQAYADFLEWYGKLALSSDEQSRRLLARLFWFTIEFGLIKHEDQFRVYGGWILSSKEETIYSVESDIPKRFPLSVVDALRTPYRHDIIQPVYFYIEQFNDLYKLMEQNLLECVKQAMQAGEFVPEFVTC